MKRQNSLPLAGQEPERHGRKIGHAAKCTTQTMRRMTLVRRLQSNRKSAHASELYLSEGIARLLHVSVKRARETAWIRRQDRPKRFPVIECTPQLPNRIPPLVKKELPPEDGWPFSADPWLQGRERISQTDLRGG